jgi:hypothetical protein
MGGPDAMSQEQWDKLGSGMHLYPSRAGTCEEVSNLVLFLLGPESVFMNGSSYLINAGAHIKH